MKKIVSLHKYHYNPNIYEDKTFKEVLRLDRVWIYLLPSSIENAVGLLCCGYPSVKLTCCWNKNKKGNPSVIPICDWI